MMTPGEADNLNMAIKYATSAHAGQYRKFSGDPYIVHPLRVMQAVEHRPLTTRIAAVLHDVVEDTDHTLDDVKLYFGQEVRTLVDALTRRPGEEYRGFIQRALEAGPEAVAIKVADLRDNLASTQLPPEALRRQYSNALDALGEPLALAGGDW